MEIQVPLCSITKLKWVQSISKIWEIFKWTRKSTNSMISIPLMAMDNFTSYSKIFPWPTSPMHWTRYESYWMCHLQMIIFRPQVFQQEQLASDSWLSSLMMNGTWMIWKSVKKSPQRESHQSTPMPKNAKLSNLPRTGFSWFKNSVRFEDPCSDRRRLNIQIKPVKVKIRWNSCLLCPWRRDRRYGRVCKSYGNWCCWYWKHSSNPKNWRY